MDALLELSSTLLGSMELRLDSVSELSSAFFVTVMLGTSTATKEVSLSCIMAKEVSHHLHHPLLQAKLGPQRNQVKGVHLDQ